MAAKALSAKAQLFAEEYRGDGVAAARAAGYGGANAVLAVTASRLLKDERVAAIIDARRAGSAPLDPSEPELRHVDVNASTPVEVLEKLMRDPTVHPSSRAASAQYLDKRQRALQEDRTDPHAELRGMVADIIRAKRAREREEEER